MTNIYNLLTRQYRRAESEVYRAEAAFDAVNERLRATEAMQEFTLYALQSSAPLFAEKFSDEAATLKARIVASPEYAEYETARARLLDALQALSALNVKIINEVEMMKL